MTTKLMKLANCSLCKDILQFTLKLTITKLRLLGKETEKGFEDITIAITLDSNVIKVEDIRAHDENVNIVKHLLFQATPETFNRKLQSSPIMVNVSRVCTDLGTTRISIADCFADAVLCDEFSKEVFEGAFSFSMDGITTCEMELSLEIERNNSDCKEFTDFLRRRDKAKAKKNVKNSSDELSITDSVLTSFTCDGDLTTDLCPLESESDDRVTTNSLRNSTSFKSSLKSSVKCRSDIATSLDINDFRDDQKTFCHGCGGFSISGITCDNIEKMPAMCKLSQQKEKKKCEIPVNRICSECFEDLTAIPHKAACPKCEQYKRLLKGTVCFKSKKQQHEEEENTRGCVRSIFEEILLGDKERLEKDLKRLKGAKSGDNNKNGSKKKKRKARRDGVDMNKKRCEKIKRILRTRRSTRHGLVAKHPGIVAGHKACMLLPSLVPKNMGWLWNVNIPGIPTIRRGWKPGAVPNSIAKIMKYFLETAEEQQPPEEPNLIKTCSNKAGLHMQRKKGEYTIVMNAAGGDGPVTFKISKSEEVKRREEIRKVLKKRGIMKNCQCEKIDECRCLNDCKKKEIVAALKNISAEYNLNPSFEFSELNESSDSEMDFEYTPPFAVAAKLRKKPPVCFASTQYEQQEIEEIAEEEIKEKGKVESSKAKAGLAKNVKAGKSKAAAKPIKEKVVKKENKKETKSTAVQILRELPQTKKYCNPCSTNVCATDNNNNNRFTTNYNPLYAQCPPATAAACGNVSC